MNSGSGELVIAVFADLHFGENEEGPWGPEQDRKSLLVEQAVLDAEAPDLVVFLGDVLTANNIAANATAYWARLDRDRILAFLKHAKLDTNLITISFLFCF